MTTSAAGFFDDLLGRHVEADASIGPSRTCCRCESVAAKARRRGDPEPPIREVESWTVDGPSSPTGGPIFRRRYYAGLCRECTDIEWSERWQARYDEGKTKGNVSAIRRLVDETREWQRRGRKFHGTLPRGDSDARDDARAP